MTEEERKQNLEAYAKAIEVQNKETEAWVRELEQETRTLQGVVDEVLSLLIARQLDIASSTWILETALRTIDRSIKISSWGEPLLGVSSQDESVILCK